MSARFLIACWPFEGHVLPLVSIARALSARGHEVAFYTDESARATVEAEGFPVHGFEHVEPSRWRQVQSAEAQAGGRRRSLRVQQQAFRDWLVETIPGQVADLRAVIERRRPDVLLSDFTMLAPGMVLWESLPIPVALWSTFMGTLIPGPDAPPWGFGLRPPRSGAGRAGVRAATRVTELLGTPLRRRVDEIRAEHGLGPLDCSLNRFTARPPLYMVGNVRELDYGRGDLPPSVHYVGPCVWHPPDPPGTAEWLARVPAERPWVHVTEGTSHQQEPFVLRAAARGLAGADVEAILTTGSKRDPASLGLETAPNVHVTRWLGHGELLPRCGALVTTGGAATCMAALRAGVPLVVVPTSWDKPDNARRIVEAGAGLRIAPRRCRPETLRAAVEEVLGDPRYAAAAQRMAQSLGAAGGPARAAELLEALSSARSRKEQFA